MNLNLTLEIIPDTDSEAVHIVIKRAVAYSYKHMKTISATWRENILEYLIVRRHYLFREDAVGKLSALRDRQCPKTNIRAYFQSQMWAILFIILQIFFGTLAVLKIGEHFLILPSLKWGS